MKVLLRAALCTSLLLSNSVFAIPVEDKIIVTASRTEQNLSQISASANIIDGDEIQTKNYAFVSDYLSEVAGINVVKDSELGGVASIFIRGASAGQTLVLIDGIRVNDMTSPENAFNDGTLPVHLIERIEIVRGPQSLAYGSSAMGGVVNIITKRATNASESNLGFETGSFNTQKFDVSTQGKMGDISYLFGVYALTSDGYSAADVEGTDNEEKDGIEQWQGHMKLAYNYSGSGTVQVSAISDHADYDIDQGAGDDDPNNKGQTTRELYSLKVSDSFYDNLWQPSLQVSHMDTSRSNTDKPDINHPQTESDNRFVGQRQSVALINHFALPNLELVVGSEFVKESAKSSYNSPFFSSIFNRKSTETKSVFTSGEFALSASFYLDAGLRYDAFDYYGDQTTYRLGSRILLFDGLTTVRFSHGTGYKSPSLYQLYAPDAGSLSLRPESSIAREISLKQSLNSYGFLALTYFEQSFKNLIDYDGNTLKYMNVNRAESKGVESELSINMNDHVGASFTLTLLKAVDQETKEQLTRRPKQQSSISLYYNGSRLQGSVTWHAKSLMEGNAFTKDTRASDNVSANLNYQYNSMLRAWLRADNIGDAKRAYLEGYTRKPFSLYVGVRATLQ